MNFGTQWLGVDKGVSAKSLFAERRDPSCQGDVHLTPSQKYGVMPQTDYMALTGNKVVLNLSGQDNMKHVQPRDFIIHLRSFQGGVEYSKFAGKVSNAYTVLTPRPTIEPRFYRWVLKSSGYIQELQATTAQLRDGQSIKFQQFGSIYLPNPSIETQRRVADFLDEQVARIDEIIRLREAQVGELKMSAAMRVAQAVESLGEAHGWISMRRVMVGIEQGWSPECESRPAERGEFGVLKLGAVRSGRFTSSENKVLPTAIQPAWSYQVRPNDLLVTRANTRPLVGDVAVVPDSVRANLFLPDLIYRVRISVGEPEFISAALRTPRIRGLVGVIARGTSQTMVKLRGEDIADLVIPAAPKTSRACVASLSMTTRSWTSEVEDHMLAQVELLRERKRSLITAAVTGEFDVSTASGRGVA